MNGKQTREATMSDMKIAAIIAGQQQARNQQPAARGNDDTTPSFDQMLARATERTPARAARDTQPQTLREARRDEGERNAAARAPITPASTADAPGEPDEPSEPREEPAAAAPAAGATEVQTVAANATTAADTLPAQLPLPLPGALPLAGMSPNGAAAAAAPEATATRAVAEDLGARVQGALSGAAGVPGSGPATPAGAAAAASTDTAVTTAAALTTASAQQPLPTSTDAAATAADAPARGAPKAAAAAEAKPELAPAATLVLGGAAPKADSRDRLLEDFERRFERALSGATGTRFDGAGGATAIAQPTLAQAYTVSHTLVATPVTQPGFVEAFSQRIAMLVGNRVQSAEIALTPADLGPINVTIELRGQEATLTFNATHATTRSALEEALPRLREMFADSGLQLANAFVGGQTQRDTRQGAARSGREAAGGVAGTDAAPAAGAAGAIDASLPRSLRSTRLIDIIV